MTLSELNRLMESSSELIKEADAVNSSLCPESDVEELKGMQDEITRSLDDLSFVEAKLVDQLQGTA